MLNPTPKYHLPTVVKLRIKGGVVVQGCDVYISRGNQNQGGWDKYIHTASEWANRFKPGKDGTLEEVIAKYNTEIRERFARIQRNGLSI